MKRRCSLALIKAAGTALLAGFFFFEFHAPANALNIAERFGATGCYARNYTADHLAKHPKQKVREIWFVPDPAYGANPDRFALRFGFSLRDGRRYDSRAYCQATARCKIEADGGRIQFTDRGLNLRMSIVDYLVVEGTDFSPNLAESDDRVFLLYPSAPSNCG